MRSMEMSAKTVEAAVQAACEALGVDRDDINVSYEVLEFPTRKLFKTIPAKVLVKVEEPEEEKPAEVSTKPAEVVEISDETAPEIQKEVVEDMVEEAELAPVPGEEVEVPLDIDADPRLQAAVDYLTPIFNLMGVENFTFTAVKKGAATVLKVSGEHMGALIGRRGETMESLSYLASLVVNRMEGPYVKLGLDVGGYRNKREDDLSALARRIADRVIRTGCYYEMEPMNPYERHIIHTAAARNAGKGGTGMIFETFRQAIQNVWSNKLRTFLTMLGIIIGVMAVIVIVGLGNGMTKSMRDSFSALGTNTLSIQVWGYGSRTVPVEEMYDICQRHSDLIKAVSPQVNLSGKASGTLKIGTTSYRWSNMSGVDENFTEMKNYQIVQGRGLQYMDMQDNKQVCVIGDYLNRVAFGGNGVGQTLKIGANKFRVVGVLSAKVSDPTMQQGSDDDCVYLPYTTVMRLSSQSMVDCYTAMMADESLANEAKSTMEEELMSILKTENGYYVYSASEWLEEMNKMINMVIVILTGIASISLLVGGIGIMNIMLVSVTERTREIGIRKALGAKERVILSQFVVEAATTSALGGVLGIVLGYIVSMAANRILPMISSSIDVTVSPSFNSIVVAFGISVGIGVLFGYLPAKRAARLNPIEALRYD